MYVNWWIFSTGDGCPFCGVQQNYSQNLDECETSKYYIHFSDKNTKPNCFKAAVLYVNDGAFRLSG